MTSTFQQQAMTAGNLTRRAMADASRFWTAGETDLALESEIDAAMLEAQAEEASRRAKRGDDPHQLP